MKKAALLGGFMLFSGPFQAASTGLSLSMCCLSAAVHS